MIPNITDEPFNLYPLLWTTVDGVEAVDVVALYGTCTRWVSCIAGNLVVEDPQGNQEVIYETEWTARPMQRLAIRAILTVTTDSEKFPSPVTNTATYPRIYL